MAKSHPPYHLRTNKAVDRLLLLDQMHKAIPRQLTTGSYLSLGGPFMEDLRLVHRRFPKKKLVCLESDNETHKRQQAHKFSRLLNVCRRTVADYLTHDYSPEAGDVFWLDFTDFNLSHLGDFQNLLSVTLPGSLVRITVRCEPPIDGRTLIDHLEEEKITALKAEAYAKLKKSLDRLIPPEWIGKDPENSEEYAIFVQQTIRLAASAALDKAHDREFLVLESARYDDGTLMLSVTGLICKREDMQSEIARLKKAGQPTDPKWANVPSVINVPYLSIQERIRLDEKLPIRGKTGIGVLQKRLGYLVGNSSKNSEEALRQHSNYYHEYPSFVRMAY